MTQTPRRGEEPAEEPTSILDDQDETSTPRRADDAKTRSRGRKVMTVFFITLLAVLVAGGGVAFYYLNRVSNAIDHINRNPTLMPRAETSTLPDGTVVTRPPTPKSSAKRQPMTFVLMGSDSRGFDQGRSDSLMVAYLSGDRQKAYLVSFPRDMWVSIPGHGKAKINAAYAWGGPVLTIQTLEQMTGVRMDHAAVIDFEGFIKLTDVLGGVTVYNEHASSSNGFSFPQGEITIRGEQALVYVRERYNLPNGDLDRAKRQRAVVQAIMGKVLTTGTIANPSKFGATVDTFAECMTVDDGLSKNVITSTAASLRLTGSDDIRSMQAPISGFGTSADGQSIDIVDEAGLAELSEAMKTDTMEAYYLKHKK
ncbi:LCP family protein [Aestuariimicrobium ganziense]|uniref:LCP family protein n=1 Tax=Aestuariimicrobium ganziense TaxID=2773677 RepID=UPI001942D994|nr:LCP family protein [Aestuariimicrobium ganziense]